MHDPISLAELHLDTLYESDSEGRLLRSRGAGVAVPSFHLVRTTAGNRWLISAALPADIRDQLDRALGAQPVIADFDQIEHYPPHPIAIGATAGLRVSGRQQDHRGPAFFFPQVLPRPSQLVDLLAKTTGVATHPNLAWVREVLPQEHPICVARDDAGRVVSVCHSSRSTPRAAEAGVETAVQYRGRGLATAVVAGWAAAVRAQGRLPMYSTDWGNLASWAVARKLGLIVYGEDFHSFTGPPLRVRRRG